MKTWYRSGWAASTRPLQRISITAISYYLHISTQDPLPHKCVCRGTFVSHRQNKAKHGRNQNIQMKYMLRPQQSQLWKNDNQMTWSTKLIKKITA
jgi:hypothetical protein